MYQWPRRQTGLTHLSVAGFWSRLGNTKTWNFDLSSKPWSRSTGELWVFDFEYSGWEGTRSMYTYLFCSWLAYRCTPGLSPSVCLWCNRADVSGGRLDFNFFLNDKILRSTYPLHSEPLPRTSWVLVFKVKPDIYVVPLVPWGIWTHTRVYSEREVCVSYLSQRRTFYFQLRTSDH